MHYQIARNGQMYGPYTMEDLQRYVASGHVLPTDLARGDEMSEWVPVSQLLGMQGAAPTSQPGFAPGPTPYQQPFTPGSAVPFPDPPNIHWAVVLLLDLVTCSLFQLVWNIILAAWFRRISPSSKAFVLYIASAVLIFVQAGVGQAAGITSGRHGFHTYGYSLHRGFGLYGLVSLVCWVVRLIARFTFRSELEQHFNTVEPMGLRINPVLTFFFGGIYFQSLMNRINDIKRGIRFR